MSTSDLARKTEKSMADDIVKLAKSISTNAHSDFIQERAEIIAARINLLIDAKITAELRDINEMLQK